MAPATTERALVLVKAFPQPSQKYEETVCCAGITPAGQFVRLYPVRYRRLKPEQRFNRWDVIEYEAIAPVNDHRPESRHVDEASIRIVQTAGQLSEASRVGLWAHHVSASQAALKESNAALGTSLGVIKPDEGSLHFRARKLAAGSPEARQIASDFKQVSLIDSEALTLLQVEYEFSYRFACAGAKHDMKIHDWEVQAAFLAYKRRYGATALKTLKSEYQERIPARNLHFVMGTMAAHPKTFIIIGLLRSGLDPQAVDRQTSLL